MKKIFLATFLVVNISYADVSYKIKKGQSSPINGVVLTEEKVVELYRIEQREMVLKDLRIVEKELTEKYKQENRNLVKKLNNTKSEVFWYKMGLGILSGFLIYRGVTK